MAQPGFWAEQVQIILPSDDNKGVKLGEDRLRGCLRLVEAAFSTNQTFRRVAFLLTEDAKIPAFVRLLRASTSRLLIGSFLPEQSWLLGALDMIIATPGQALHYDRAGHLSSITVRALLIDKQASADSVAQAFSFASAFAGFEEFASFSKLDVQPRQWFAPPRPAPASSHFLEKYMPLTKCYDGWEDSLFTSGLTMFSWGKSNVLIHDWADLPLFLPGIIRCSRSRVAAPLVLAPRDKLPLMAELLQACATELGVGALNISNREGAHVLVDSIDELVMPSYVGSLVVVQADELLESACAWKIRRLVNLCMPSQIGIHCSTKTPAVEELLSARTLYSIPEAKVSMRGVCEFFALADSKHEKLEKLCTIWEQLESSKCRVSIFCIGSSTVDWLVEEMRNRGFVAWALHRGEEVDPDVYRNPFSVIVTDVYRRASQDVINFDLPGTYDEYVQRVGNDRGRSIKVVINIGTTEEQRCFPDMVPLPADCYRIHTKLPLWFDV
ncbi:eukaryotic initiation factor 4A-8 [Selaginella moellendorffii]|nr:eukaryotic initiation factor 4A-8 [Selaginella moellendorffii]|eukprot:XP_024516585.1 eukaryotic initiation factor 4A-8 [Selaginella moellendorffii]